MKTDSGLTETKVQTQPADRPSWQFITSNTAWKLCEKFGSKAAPYCGYMVELNDGRAIRCRKDAHKTVFEIRAASHLNISASNMATP